MARVFTAKLESKSPYSPSRYYEVEKLNKESHDAFDNRTWRERAHVHASDEVFIPPMAFKFSIAEAAKRLSIPIKGKAKQTYTKNILSGLVPFEPVNLGISKAELPAEKVWCHANGKRGPGTRVMRTFPIVHQWSSTLTMGVLDDEIPADVIERCLSEAGNLIGVGRFRPENGGYFGRFAVLSVSWSK